MLGKQPWGLTAEPLLVLENSYWEKNQQIMALNCSNFYVCPQQRGDLLYFCSFPSKLLQGAPPVEKRFGSLRKESKSSAPFRMGKFSVRVQQEKLLKIIKPWKFLKLICLYQLVSWKPRSKKVIVLARSEDRILILPQIFTQRDGQSCTDTAFVLKAAEHKHFFL